MSKIALWGLNVYKKWLSPLLPPCCIYHPTCSGYARQAIVNWGLWRGLLLAAKRLLRCHPWGRGGYDPVPGKKGHIRCS